MKREHSRKPDVLYEIIEACSPGVRAWKWFARGTRAGWMGWGNQADCYTPTWPTWVHHSQATLCQPTAGYACDLDNPVPVLEKR